MGGKPRVPAWVLGGVGLGLLIVAILLRPLTAAVATLEADGVPRPQILLPLLVPIVAFLIVLCRNVVGLDTFGIFTPALLAIAFLSTGLLLGLLLFGILLVVGSAVRVLFERYPLLAFPRMGVVLSAVALLVFAMMYFGSTSGLGQLAAATALPMVILTMVIERFVSVQVEETSREALRLTFHTLVVALLVFLAVGAEPVQMWLLAFPEISLVAVMGTVLLGRWTGLRLTEYRRFREVPKRGVR